MNPFAGWTQAEVAAHNARVGGNRSGKTEAMNEMVRKVLRENRDAKVVRIGGIGTIAQIVPKKRALLNKTETLWKQELERRGHKIILAQAITFNLGDRLNYRPDLVTIGGALDGTFCMTCWETKAPHRFKNAGIGKIKFAAKLYPWIRWVLVMRDRKSWTEREIGNE